MKRELTRPRCGAQSRAEAQPRELTPAHFAMRRWMIGLAASGAASLLTGFAGVALGLPEWVFMGFVAIAFACVGLALLFVEHLTVAREEREEPEIVARPVNMPAGRAEERFT